MPSTFISHQKRCSASNGVDVKDRTVAKRQTFGMDSLLLFNAVDDRVASISE